MKKKKQTWYGYIVFGVILLFQTISYFTIGTEFLKLQILPDYFVSLNHQSDSLFVREYTNYHQSSDSRKYFSIHLKNQEKILKKKFKVKHISFENEDTLNVKDKNYGNYKLYYETYASKGPWYTLFDLYGAKQTEILVVDQKFVYTRETKHQWVLFFWIKTYEYFTIENLEK